MSHVWNHAYAEGADSMGHSVLWYTDTSPVQALTLESPGGPGDILLRTELYVQAGYYTFLASPNAAANAVGWPNIFLATEVYSVGTGGFPDPRSASLHAQSRAAFRLPGMNFLDHNGNPWVVATGSTDGYVTSKGIRSPAQYGGGHPEIRLGLWTSNIGTGLLLEGNGEGTWSLSLAALWDVA